jgi:hypothetical protein
VDDGEGEGVAMEVSTEPGDGSEVPGDLGDAVHGVEVDKGTNGGAYVGVAGAKSSELVEAEAMKVEAAAAAKDRSTFLSLISALSSFVLSCFSRGFVLGDFQDQDQDSESGSWIAS